MSRGQVPSAHVAEGFYNGAHNYVNTAIQQNSLDGLRLAFAEPNGITSLIREMENLRAYDMSIKRGPAVNAEWNELIGIAKKLKAELDKIGVSLNRK